MLDVTVLSDPATVDTDVKVDVTTLVDPPGPVTVETAVLVIVVVDVCADVEAGAGPRT